VRAEVVFLYSSVTRRRAVRAEVVFLYLYIHITGRRQVRAEGYFYILL
jgi:hypothetical protein